MGGGRGAYEGGGVSEAVGAIRLHSPPGLCTFTPPPLPRSARLWGQLWRWPSGRWPTTAQCTRWGREFGSEGEG